MEGTKKLSTLCLAFVVLLAAVPAFAQVDYSTATLKGIVTDPTGAVISGATVTVANPATGTTKTTKTNSEGSYQIPALPPGSYQLTIEASGFSREVVKNLELSVGQSAAFDVHLKVGTISDIIEVSGDSIPLIQTEQTQQANLIDQRQMEELPNLGRNITQQVYTLPGVANSEAPRSQTPGFTGFHTTGFSIGGSNGRNNLSTIDGGENEYGTGQYRTSVPVDIIQEYQVNRNAFAAEFGFTDGSAINIVTKSGTSAYHGDAFGFFRNNSTEATNFFNGLAGFPHAFDQSLYTGGTFGGPIVKDKLFFVLSHEYQRLDSPSFNFPLTSSTVQGPNAAQVGYVNSLKTSGDPFLVGFANGITPGLSPLNNPALNTILHRDNGIFDNPIRHNSSIAKFDWNPNSNNNVTLRLTYRHDDDATRFPDGSGLFTRDFAILGNWTKTISPTLVNQVLVQIVPRNVANNIPNPFTGTNFSLGNLNIGGLGGTSSFGSPSLVPYLAHQQRYQFEDDITWTHSAHTIKMGVSYRPANYHVEDDLWFNNQFDFRDGVIPLISLAPAAVQGHLVGFNLAHGLPATGPLSTNLSAPQSVGFGLPVDVLAGFNNPKWQGWGHYFGSYAQDSWKLNSRFTLNAGVRFDVDGEPSPLGTSFYASPRLGFAWDPWGDHKTVVRAGAGIYYAPIDVLIPSYGSLLDGSGRYINEVLSVLSPTNNTVAKLWGLGVAKGELPFGHLTAADFAAVGINTTSPGATVGYSVNPNYKNPYTFQSSLSVARELAKNMSLELGYLMYHGVHLQMPLETAYQQINPGNPLCPTPACTDITGGPLYSPTTGQLQHTSYESIGSSVYHAFTASLTKRYSSGLQFQANYTWSKAIDNVIDFASFQNWFRPSRLDLFRAVSVFDIPHTFVANAVYTTPFKTSDGNFLFKALADISVAPV
ncbi:MAG TPA: carboxypeptidase regulatory-like domain-containing protein, partial [Candidatus Angelobacter sp.]|nr:carboxypeptidase regulatory-like domain-containing protein [Candidatus Angelobacter sp.]